VCVYIHIYIYTLYIYIYMCINRMEMGYLEITSWDIGGILMGY